MDYKLYSYGQDYPDDQFNEIIKEMGNADIIVIGSPLYKESIIAFRKYMLTFVWQQPFMAYNLAISERKKFLA